VSEEPCRKNLRSQTRGYRSRKDSRPTKLKINTTESSLIKEALTNWPTKPSITYTYTPTYCHCAILSLNSIKKKSLKDTIHANKTQNKKTKKNTKQSKKTVLRQLQALANGQLKHHQINPLSPTQGPITHSQHTHTHTNSTDQSIARFKKKYTQWPDKNNKH